MSTPVIIGVMSTYDAGKTLLYNLIDKNIKEDVFYCFDKSQTIDCQTIKLMKDDLPSAMDIVKLFGSNLPDVNRLKSMIDSKNKLKEMLSKVTDRPYVFIEIAPGEFDTYCDLGVFLYRDMRASWVVTSHKNPGLFSYVTHNNKVARKVDRCDKRDNILGLKFENIIADQELELYKFFGAIGATPSGKFNSATQRYNTYYTRLDLLRMRANANNTQDVTDKDLHLVSVLSEQFNETLGYEKELKKSDLFPSTIYEDIDKQVRSSHFQER